LKKQFENGLVSWSKLEKVAYVATPNDEAEWAQRVTDLPQPALEIYVQNVRNNRLEVTPQGTFIDQNENQSIMQPRERFSFEVSPETAFKFRKLKQQFEKKKGEAMSFEQTLQELLTRVEKRAPMKKTLVVERCPDCVKRREKERFEEGEVKRSIPVDVQQVVRARQNSRCAFPSCSRPLTSFHHTRRFALIPSHDPDFIVGLCTAHERVAHASLIENETHAPTEWTIRAWPDENTLAFQIDQKVAAHRKEPSLLLSG
jgi:hypothetical protein